MKNSQLKIQEGPKKSVFLCKIDFRIARFWGANFRPLRVVQVFLFVVLWERGLGTIWSEINIYTQPVCGRPVMWVMYSYFLSNCSQRDCKGPKCLACRTGVYFFTYLANRGESEASAKRESRARGGPRKKLCLFCRLQNVLFQLRHEFTAL